MDLETIKRINRDALRVAKESSGEKAPENAIDNQMTAYIVAILFTIGTYVLLRNIQPEFVMSVSRVDGSKVFDDFKAIIASILVGIIVLYICITKW